MLVELFNEMNKIEHYNGSGWLDYKMHLSSVLKQFGFKVESNDDELRLT